MLNFPLIREGSNFNQKLCAFLICIPMFCYGNTIGWMSPMTLLLQSNRSPKGEPLTDIVISWMASLPYLVCMPATYLMSSIGDRYGRKRGLLFMSGICVAVWLLKLCSMNTWVFLTARSLVGVVMAGSCVTCPTYIKEISQDNLRGALGCWGTLFFTTGNLFAYIIGDICSYQVVLIVFMVIPVVHFLLFLIMPESPSYLIKQGKEEEASKSLVWLRCRTEHDFTIRDEIEYIKKEQKNDEDQGNFKLRAIQNEASGMQYLVIDYPENFLYATASTSFGFPITKDREIFSVKVTDKILRRAFQISLVAVLTREFCGAVLIMNFAGDLFQLASAQTYFSLSPNQQAMMLGAVQLSGAILAAAIVERTGRRSLFFVACVVSGLSMFFLATWFELQHLNLPAWIPMLTLCLCIFSDSSGFLPISVVIAGETFSFKYRGTVLATTMSVASIAEFLQLLYFKYILKSVGVQVILYIFGAMCILTAVYVFIVVPETRNRTLEEIYYDLRTKKEKKEIEERDGN